MIGRLVAVAVGAACYALALPPLDWSPLAWVALVPLLLVARRRSPAAAAGYGLLWGFAMGWAATWWLAQAVAAYFDAGVLLGGLAMSAAYTVAVGSCFAGVAAGVAFCSRRLRGLPLLLATAALCTTADLVRGRLFGQPWALLGYTQHAHTALVQLVTLTGVYGLTFLVALGNAALAEMVGRLYDGDRLRAAAKTLLAPTAIIAGVWLAGWSVLPPATSVEGGRTVAVVQSNVPPAFTWTRAYAEQQLAANLRLTSAAVGPAGLPAVGPAGLPAAVGPAGLIVWPENALSLYLENEPLLAAELQRRAAGSGADLLVGGPRFADGHTYNSVRLFRADGRPGGHYDKQRLVPFAEAPPTGAPATDAPSESPRAFTAGTAPGVLPGFVPLGVSICHEALYPDLAAAAVRAGAELLVNVANDGWLDGRFGLASRQHFAMATLRAVETRRYLVRAATTGVSGIVDPWGRVLTTQSAGTAGIAQATVAARHDLTPYVRVGDAFAFGCAALSALALAIAALPRRRPAPLPALVPART